MTKPLVCISKFKHILFDVDDTLLDFKQSEEISLKLTRERFFQDIEESRFVSDYERINRCLWQQVEAGTISVSLVGQERFLQVSSLYGKNSDPLIAEYYEDGLIHHSEWLDGAERMLGAFKAAGWRIGLLSNGFKKIQRDKYERFKFARFSDELIISEEVGVSKPHPAIFQEALKQIGGKAESTLMVGDSLASDGLGAHRSGLPFCWYNPGNLPLQAPIEPIRTLTCWKEFSPGDFL